MFQYKELGYIDIGRKKNIISFLILDKGDKAWVLLLIMKDL